MTKVLVIPDSQVKPGVDTSFLTWIGNYIVEKKPDTIIHLGDFADMPSLSSYDVGKKSFEGRRYKDDIASVHDAMERLLAPIEEYNKKAKAGHRERYNPKRIILLGNHEDRISRATENDPKLDGTIGLEDLKYKEYGWEVVPYLVPIVIDGVAYCHYFVTGVAGRPAGSASAQLKKTHMSAIAGHQQGFQMHSEYRGDGRRITSIIAGSCYLHDENYLGPQGNKHWRGILVLHEVKEGEFDLMPVSLNYLRSRYG